MTIDHHNALQEMCQNHMMLKVDQNLHAAVKDMQTDLSTMNANLCHLMGSLNVHPIVDERKRRKGEV